MRKHPLLAFAATSTGLTIGSLIFSATGVTAVSASAHYRSPKAAPTMPSSAHRSTAGHVRIGHRRQHVTRFLSSTGPAQFLLPNSVAQTLTTPTTSSTTVWSRLRTCESSGNYAENSGNGYYGAYQFTLGSWTEVGMTGLPSAATTATQDLAAQRLLTLQGWGAWPNCSWAIGVA